MKNKQSDLHASSWRAAVVIGVLSIAMFVSFVLVIRFQHRSYVSEATSMVYQIKGETLKSNVMEIVQDIERFRKWEADRDWEEIRSFSAQLSAEEGTIEEVIRSPGGNSWLVNGYRFYVWDESENAVVFASSQIEAHSLTEMKNAVADGLAVSMLLHKGDQTAVCGCPKSLVDFRTKQYIYNKIHSLVFEDGSYIWVNEVVDYDGGDGYAIRRIHPNPNTPEGAFLSTETQDVEGNYPYRDELEGVKANGECYNTYYYYELDSDEISQKYAYAYLYKPYDWIICMGSYTSDIEAYQMKLQQDSTRIMTVGILSMAALLVLLILSVANLIRQTERLRFGKEREQLERVSTVDPLTGAINRRGGQPRLAELLEACQQDGAKSVLVMIDIDNFKQINDTYGHDLGDKALSSLAAAIRRSFRAEDFLIRWGGDEFLLAVRGMGPEGQELLRTKLYAAADSADVAFGDIMVPIRISSGAAVFKADDESYMDALNRADRALYQAKRSGKGIMFTNW